MANRNIEELLGDHTCFEHEAQGSLTRLFRIILSRSGRNKLSVFNTTMNAYLNDRSNDFYYDVKRKSSERSNMIKEICRPTMTWKVFRKCIKMLGAVEMRLSVSLTWRNGNTEVYELPIQVAQSTLHDLDTQEGFDMPDATAEPSEYRFSQKSKYSIDVNRPGLEQLRKRVNHTRLKAPPKA